MNAQSAYLMIVTPDKDLSVANIANRYEAEYATLSGQAILGNVETNYSGTGYAQGFGGTNNAAVTYVTSVPNDGYYNVKLRYSAGSYSGAPTTRYAQMKINDVFLKNVQCNQTANWSTWADANTTVFLQAGINRITFSAYISDESDCVNQDYIDVTAGSGAMTSYEAEASGNTLAGNAVASADSAASGGYVVGWIGNGSGNTLQFNNVNAPTTGRYRMVVRYANFEYTNGNSFQIVNRIADITVNGTLQVSGTYFRNTYGWSNFYTTVIDLNLNAGNNTIKFSNSSSYTPNIDKISITTP
jgi:hypothetical protein